MTEEKQLLIHKSVSVFGHFPLIPDCRLAQKLTKKCSQIKSTIFPPEVQWSGCIIKWKYSSKARVLQYCTSVQS